MSRKVIKNAGRFKIGNAGGPGRPRRAVEVDYLAALSDAVPMDRWRKICERAAKDAEGGDAGARAWIGKHLLGESSLVALAGAERTRAVDAAALESQGLSDDDIFRAQVDERLHPSANDEVLARLVNGETLHERARRLKEAS